MSVMDILKSYLDRPTDTHQDFDEVARQVPADALAGGLADAFRSDRTPDFGQMVSSLFTGSNAQQRSGLLQQLAGALGPTLLANVAGGLLGRVGGGSASSGNTQTAESISPDQVREIATAAEKQDPSVMDRIGSYYAQHPDVVKVLGGTALAVALGHIAGRMKR
jgi:hypothetical protein